MPLYFRRSIEVGPFRFNLSKSGIGLSTGVKGFRIGTGPRGHYIHAGMKGVYYRKTFGNSKSSGSSGKEAESARDQSTRSVPAAVHDALPSSYVTSDGVVMKRIMSADAVTMEHESRREVIADLNRAQSNPSLALLFGVLGVGVSLVFALAAIELAAVISGLVTALFVAVGQRIDLGRRQVVFFYDLDETAERNYGALTEAWDGIKGVRNLWYIDAAGAINNLTAWKRNAGASELVDKHETAASYEEPPGVQSNVTPPTVRVGDQTLYFYPDFILVRESKQYGAVAYADIRTAVRDQRFIVDGPTPSDAQVVGETWAHPNKNGGPDRRFANNRRLAICLFEEIGMIGSTGLKVLLQLSRRGRAQPLAQAISRLGPVSQEDRSEHVVLLTNEAADSAT
ncbi:DUF4236 domain-containing protein [Antarctobacter sp.]|uniref:DUF4236 domain-containing protein n=1 Tax=Antarctobacter sp. TaxID=1872577 RepID=UPI002B27B576|nr:DUF4236 domain-containing protein [Antarctobacter sp.]